MGLPSLAQTGRFNGPFQWFVIQDDSSYFVGSSAPMNSGAVNVNNSSTTSGGVITGIYVADPTTSSTAHIILSVDNSSNGALQSSLMQFSAFAVMSYPLNIGFTTGFNIHNSSTSGHTIVTYFTQG